ncbi:MAG TPA: hypothetical protein VN783_16905 [Thermoanaerobaculia bacterium]|nr:hypothetical protein [Thermoanaerobaculia bacterium]
MLPANPGVMAESNTRFGATPFALQTIGTGLAPQALCTLIRTEAARRGRG